MENKVYDITIVGGGPAGLFAAFYAGLRQASVKIIESMPQLGGQLRALYPEKYIYDVAGFSKIRAKELVARLEEQMKQFHPTICLQQSVQDLERLDERLIRLTTDKETHLTKTVIITAGVGAFQPRKLNIDGIERYENKNLHYFIQDLEHFRGKNVVVCGGGDSAVDWALMLESIAKNVTIVHRRRRFRAHEHSVQQLYQSTVTVKTPYQPIDVLGNEKIETVIIERGDGEEILHLPVDELVVNYGFISSLGPLKNIGVEIENNSIVVNSKMETNIPGVYAAGDITTFEGKVKLIATGFGEAPTAVNNAKAYIDPEAKIQPLHSTTVMA